MICDNDSITVTMVNAFVAEDVEIARFVSQIAFVCDASTNAN